MGTLKAKAQSILTEKNTKIIPSNIETGLQTQLDVNSSDRNKFLGVYRYSE